MLNAGLPTGLSFVFLPVELKAMSEDLAGKHSL